MRSPFPCFLIRSAYSSAAAARRTALAMSTSASTSASPSLMTVPTISIDDLRSHVQSTSSSSTSPSDFTTSSCTHAVIREAFTGRSSLGSISVQVPGFDKVRRNALTSGAWLALDPSAASARDSCRSTELDARVQPGWSGNPGREDHRIQSGFYYNLQEELDPLNQSTSDDIFGSNVWPDNDECRDAEIDLRGTMVQAGQIMQEVTSLVLEAARDAAISEAKSRGLGDNDFKQITTQSDSFLPCRLTYYDANHSREDTLTGGNYLLPWHVDFNTATAFISAEWIDEDRALEGDGIEVQTNNPEKRAGLLLRNAAGDVVPASIAEDCILIQLGAYAQLVTGGLLRAGPHAVGHRSEGVESPVMHRGRLTLGLFTYAPWDARMLPPNSKDEAAVLEDDFGGLMKRAYTGDTVLAGFQSFANYMNLPRDANQG